MTVPTSPRKLQRVLRVRDGLAVTVGIVIGAGILGTPGLIAGYLGDPVTILAMWFFGGIVAGLSTLVLAEMAAALPEAGGKFVYARHAWGPTMGFVAGWSELLVTRGFSGASKAVLIATYIITLTGTGSVRILALAVVLGYFVLHTRGLKTSTTFQNVTTLIKVLIVLTIAAVGLAGGNASGLGTEALVSGEVAGLLGYALAYQSISFAYYGWEDAAKMSEEVMDPGRALPKILLGGAMAVMVLYLLMNISFLAAMTPAEMAGSELVAADATAAVFGDAAGTIVVVASLLILISSANVNFLGLPRVAYGLAKNGLAPRAYTEVDERGTPRNALYFISAWIALLALTGAFELLIRFMMTVAITVDTMVLLGYFKLRASQPDLERPFRMPGHPVLPALTIMLYIAILIILVWTQPMLALGAGSMLAALLVAGVVTTRRQAASR
ncbi:MAG: amino acid permease [Gemmatimonadetes bacterium]|nr:amino acid permease [Gemmatimonadota bacterium]NNF14923.1 amino acid permease [Gemmatimonadota bacterium]NNL31374.1 amino acid permease [Gemmatimonadota bacterium]